MKIITMFIFIMVLSGCAVNREVSREDWLNMTSHTFKNTNVDSVLKAADKVLQLSDPDDVTVSHSPDSILGYRKFMIYAVLSATFGRYEFALHAQQKGPDVETRLDITSGTAAVFGPENRNQWKYREPYDLYYSRVGSILYGDMWTSCETAEAKAEQGWLLEPMCLLASDNIPRLGVQLTAKDQEKLAAQLRPIE